MFLNFIGSNKKKIKLKLFDNESLKLYKDKSSLEADTDTNRGRVVFFNKSIT